MPDTNDNYPIEHLEERIKFLKKDTVGHIKEVTEIKKDREKYVKWPRIYASFADEIEKEEKGISDASRQLMIAEKELAEEKAKLKPTKSK